MALYDLPTLKETYSDLFYATLLAILESNGGSSGDIAIPRLTLIFSVKVKVDELMAQSEGIQFSLSDTENSNVIDLYINSLLDETAKHIHQTAPLHAIVPNDGGTISPVSNADNSGYLYLPSDYLRFVTFKMQGWSQDVTEPITVSDPKYKLQKYSVTRGGAAKPVVVLNSGIKINTPVAKVVSVLLEGISGSCNINVGGVERLAEFDSSLTTTATNFVTDYAADYLVQGIILTSVDNKLIFTANVAGVDFYNPVILNVDDDLTGAITIDQANVPAREPKRTIEYYSDPTAAHVIDKFLYVANVPAEYVQEDLWDALTWLCASKLLQIWGQVSDQGAGMANVAQQQVELSYQNLM